MTVTSTPRQKSHVTSREAQAVADFACELLGYLDMPGWRVLVLEDPCDTDATASIDNVFGQYTAQLRLCGDWMKLPDEKRLETVTHEVVHLLHIRINHVFEDAQEYMHDHEHESLMRRYRRETEYMVDHLAKFIARHSTIRQVWDNAHKPKGTK